MMKRISCSCLFFAIFSMFAVPALAELRLPRVFGDKMVLQREMPVPIWGYADKGERVSVAFQGNIETTVADENGKWMVRLPAMKATNKGSDLTVNGTNSQDITFRDVVVGEVWLCSGQSNMEWTVGGCGTNDGNEADFADIRFIRVSKVQAPEPAEDLALDRPWSTCQNGNTNGCTAVGFYFARRLYKELNVPIGLIDDAWGGSPIDQWFTVDGLKSVEQLKQRGELVEKNRENYRKALPEYIGNMENWVKDSRRRLETDRIVQPLPQAPSADGTGNMFNAMVAPVAPYAMRGYIWYQGESNAGDRAFYFYKQQALAEGWRKLWNQPGDDRDFPFYFVQLANYMPANDNPEGDYNGWPQIRDAQTKSLEIKNTGMAVTIDIGDEKDIHPRNKFDVGERLALWALAKNYGQKNLVYSGPIYRDMKIEGNSIRLSFDHTGSGLVVGEKDGRKPTAEVKDGKLKRFAVAGEDKKWVWADAKIDGNTVVVSSADVPNPVAVRYAWSNCPTGCNLYNKEGLPASPFRTDAW